MSDDKINITCPHCGNSLEGSSSFVGEQVACPCCNRNFVVRPPQETAGAGRAVPPVNNTRATDTAAGNEGKKAYPWGRAYIALARILALLAVIATLGMCIYFLHLPFSIRNKALKALEKEVVPDLVERQKKFQDNYIKIADLVMSGNTSRARFNFPQDLVSPPGFFDERLITEEDVGKSLQTLKLYDEKIAKMSLVMNKYFLQQYQRIFRLVNSGNAIKMTFGSSSARKNNSLSMTFGQSAEFYTNEKEKVTNDINAIRYFLSELENRKKINQLRYQREVDTIKRGVDFIEERLNAEQKRVLVGSQSNSPGPSQESVVSGRDMYGYEKNLLQRMIISLTRLSSHENRNYYSWMIARESEKLKEALKEQLQNIVKINERFSENIKQALLFAFGFFLTGVFFAFLLMVLADYLQAHFDSAVSLKSIDRKVKNFLMLPLLFLLFLTGCGESPDKFLPGDSARLQSAAIDALLANQISENPDATAYHVPGKELILISGGIKKVTVRNVAYGGVYSSASHVICNSSVSFSSVEKYDKSPFTHRARLQLNVNYQIRKSDMDKNPDGTPGLEVHFLLPDNFNESTFDKERWIDNKLAEIPESQENHSVIIHNLSKNKPIFYNEHKVFTICFNGTSKRWELENPVTPISVSKVPVYSKDKLEEVMKGFNFKKLETTVDGEKSVFWFKEQDHEIADKIWNQGLMFDGGVWKKRTVVFNTRALSKSLDDWKRKNKVSLNDVENLLNAIKNNPEAENRQIAVSVVEDAMENIFLQVKGEEYKKERERLEYVLQFIQTTSAMSLVNRSKLEALCKEKIDFAVKKIKEREAFLAAQREKIKSMISTILKAVKGFESDYDVNKLSSSLKQFPDLLKFSPYQQAVERWQSIADIATNKAHAVNALFQSDGTLRGYLLLKRCGVCNGSGLQSCNVCNNSGLCTMCHGRGRRTVTVNSLSRGYYTTELSCVRTCQRCNGRKKRCNRCRRGRYMNIQAVKDAFTAELGKIQQLLEKVQSEL